jgi:hypothetical protein
MAQAKADQIIEVIGVDKATAVLHKVSRAQDGITTSTQKTANVSSDLLVTYGKMAIGIGAAVVAAQQLVKQLEAGGRAVALSQQIDSIAGAAEKVAAATAGLRGVVDETTIQAEILLLDKLGFTAEQLRTAGAFALTEATRTGRETVEVFKQVSRALVTGEKETFKTLGLRIVDINDAFVQMAAAADGAASSLDGNVSIAVQQLTTDLNNLKSTGQETFAIFATEGGNAIQGLSNNFADLVRGLTPVDERLNDTKTELGEIVVELIKIKQASDSRPFSLFDEIRVEKLQAAVFQMTVLNDLWPTLNSGVSTFVDGLFASQQPLLDWANTVGDAMGRAFPFLLSEEERKKAFAKAPKAPTPRGGRGGSGSSAGAFQQLDRDAFQPGADIASFIASGQVTGRGNVGVQNVGTIGGAGAVNAEELLSPTAQAFENFARTMESVRDSVAGSFGAIGDAFGATISALSDTGAISRTGGVAKALAAVQIAAIVAQAGVNAGFEFAAGLRDAANGNAAGAALHFASSVQFAAVAATNVAGAVAGVSKSSAAPGEQPSGLAPGTGQAQQQQQQQGPTLVILNTTGDVIAEIERAAARGEPIPASVLSSDVQRAIAGASGGL